MSRQTIRELAERVRAGVARAGGSRTRREIEEARQADELLQRQERFTRQARRLREDEYEADIRRIQDNRVRLQAQFQENVSRIEELRRLDRIDFDRERIKEIANLEANNALLQARMFNPSGDEPSQETQDSIYQRTYDYIISRTPQTPRESYRGNVTGEDDPTEREMPQAEPEAEREDLFINVPNYNVLRLRADLASENAQSNLNTQLANGFNTRGLRDA